MSILDRIFKRTPDWSKAASQAIVEQATPEANMYNSTYTEYYDGEKTPGELGAPVNVVPDFETLSIRAREMYLKSDIAKIIVNTYVNWVVGDGLKLQSEPVASEIEKEGFAFDRDQFVKDSETRFRLYVKTKACDYKGNTAMVNIARMAKKAAIIDGDVLVILRTTKQGPNVQLISGTHVKTPIASKYVAEAEKRGNKIYHGVEVDKRGAHIAYYVAEENFSYTRILAKGSRTGRLQAFLYYGDEFRIDDVRGLPIFATNIEKMKKIDRYIEATVGSAEERAKIPLFVEHGVNSTNENPLLNTLKMASNAGEGNEQVGAYGTMEDTSKKVAQTTGKNLINLPNDSTLKSIDSRNEIAFGDFVNSNFIYLCASVNIPYEVALNKFEGSFSSSRMAAKQWEHILKVERELFSGAFYKPFYNIFLELQILGGKIQAEGYFTSLQRRDAILLEAYQNSRFIGANVPHVDPLKEVKAEIAAIDANLQTYETATEKLGNGEFSQNMEKLAKETEQLIIKEPEKEPVPNQVKE